MKGAQAQGVRARAAATVHFLLQTTHWWGSEAPRPQFVIPQVRFDALCRRGPYRRHNVIISVVIVNKG